MFAEPHSRYCFGEYELSPAAHSLKKGSKTIDLAPKEFKTLLLLVEQAGTIVERETFIKKVWDGAFVGDGSLTRTISVLRRHIGSDGIENIPRLGYRFALPVTKIEPAAPGLPEVSPIRPQPKMRHSFGKRGITVAAFAMLTTLIAFAAWRERSQELTALRAAADTPYPLAREAYLRGRYDLDQKNVPDFYLSAQEFEEAVRIDPQYARAWAGLSEVYINFGAGNSAIHPAYAKAKVAATTALRIDPGLGEAHRDLAYVLCWDERNWTAAEGELREALRLNSHDSKAHEWYAQFLAARKRPQEGLAEAKKGLELDPLSIGSNYNYGAALIQAGQLDAAIKHLQGLTVRNPENEVAYGYLGIALNRLGRHAEAAEMFEQALERSGNKNIPYRAGVGWSRALAGDTASGREVYGELTAQWEKGEWVPAYDLALLAISLDEKQDALGWAERAVQDCSLSIYELNTEPMLVALDGEPRFQTIRRSFQ